MNTLTRKIQKRSISIIFFVFTLQNFFSCFAAESSGQASLVRLKFRVDQITQELERESDFDEEEKMVQEFVTLFTRFYNRMLEISVLYCSGYFIDSAQFHQQILIEVSKDLLVIAKTLTNYLPKLMNNPELSWKKRMKKGALVMSFLVVIAILMKEIYGYNQANKLRTGPMPPSGQHPISPSFDQGSLFR